MTSQSDLGAIRGETLDRIDRAKRRYHLAFAAAAGMELAFLAGYLLLADFSNRLHVLLLLATVAVYSLTALGLVALGAHANRNTLRVLRALELMDRGAS